MKFPVRVKKDEDLNVRYNLTARNSLVDMNWRVLKYGENIFLGEVKKLVDYTVDVFDIVDKERRKVALKTLRANNDLDKEMNRLSQVIENLSDIEITETKTVTDVKETIEFRDESLKSPVFKLTKIKPVKIEPNFENVTIKLPILERQKESAEMTVQPDVKAKERSPTIERKVKMEFWKLFQDDTEWWKALAERNLEQMEETRRELERFSGHELVLGEIQSNLKTYEKEKETLQSFIDEVDKSKLVKKDLEYDKKYEDMVLKLINFAKKDFIYRGFDPLIQQLQDLSNVQINKRKTVNIEEIVNIYTKIDITKYTYEELCLLEKYYKDIIRKYKHNKENVPKYHKNIILNLHSSVNTEKNKHQYINNTVQNGGVTERNQTKNQNTRNNLEIFDLTRTYPVEYYANNWWSIYEDILKTREQQFGTIDQWWNFYESILTNKDTSEEKLNRIRSILQNRQRKRPNSRVEEQLKMIDEIKNDRFQESEAVSTDKNESVRILSYFRAINNEDSMVWCLRPPIPGV